MMAKLPSERVLPAPAWAATSVDFFGPFSVKGEVNKRSRGKAYGVLFNCLVTRAIHVEISPDYSTDGFLSVLRRFASIRGYPAKMYSDPGSQLVAADRELREAVESYEWDRLKDYGAENGMSWHFTAADAPWQNGCAESLVKSIKKAIKGVVGEQILTFSELQTVMFEAANLVNERPIGQHPTEPDETSYLSPNHLLLGRASSRIPSGPFDYTKNQHSRFKFIQQLVDNFWKRWIRFYFPSLLIQAKWHVEKRNVSVGDVVLVQDSNEVRGKWKLGIVSETHPGKDDKVRSVKIQYKNPKNGERCGVYEGHNHITIERPVQKIVVVIPAEERK